jgi:hypothetical protein
MNNIQTCALASATLHIDGEGGIMLLFVHLVATAVALQHRCKLLLLTLRSNQSGTSRVIRLLSVRDVQGGVVA